MSASPWPPPPQSAAAPTPPPRRLSSSARCRAMRAPDMPIGWPEGDRAAVDVDLVGVDAELLGRGQADRGERLVDLDQVEVGGRDALLLRRPSRWRGPAGSAGSSRGRRRRRARRSRRARSGPAPRALALLITTTAAAPSEICEAEPAVMVPSLLNAGRSRDRVSVVVSARMPSSVRNSSGSPLRCGIATGTTSSSNSPSFQAWAASWWLRAENASCSSRVNVRVAGVRGLGQRAHRLVGERVPQPVVGHVVAHRSRRRT